MPMIPPVRCPIAQIDSPVSARPLNPSSGSIAATSAIPPNTITAQDGHVRNR